MNKSEIIIGRRYKHTDQSVDVVDQIDGDYVVATEVSGPGGRTPRPEWVRHRWLTATFTDYHTPVLPLGTVKRVSDLDRVDFDFGFGPIFKPFVVPAPQPYMMFKIDLSAPIPSPVTDEQRVANAISDIATRPTYVGLTHAKILRDEITRLRSELAKSNKEKERLNGVESKSNEILTALAEANEELCDRVMDVVEDVIGLRVPLEENEEDPLVLRQRLCRTMQALSALDDLEPVITKLRQREIEALADE